MDKMYVTCLVHMSVKSPDRHSVEILRNFVELDYKVGNYKNYEGHKIIKLIYEAYMVFSSHYLKTSNHFTIAD